MLQFTPAAVTTVHMSSGCHEHCMAYNPLDRYLVRSQLWGVCNAWAVAVMSAMCQPTQIHPHTTGDRELTVLDIVFIFSSCLLILS